MSPTPTTHTHTPFYKKENEAGEETDDGIKLTYILLLELFLIVGGFSPHPLRFGNEFFLHLLFTSPFLAVCVCVYCHQTGRVFFCRLASSTFTYFLLCLALFAPPPLPPLSSFPSLAYICVSVYLGIRP